MCKSLNIRRNVYRNFSFGHDNSLAKKVDRGTTCAFFCGQVFAFNICFLVATCICDIMHLETFSEILGEMQILGVTHTSKKLLKSNV